MTAAVLTTNLHEQLKKGAPIQDDENTKLTKGESNDSGDDADVVFTKTTRKPKTKAISHHLSSENCPNGSSSNNLAVKAILDNRNNYDQSWALAAQSIFSDSHPFNAIRRNRNQGHVLSSRSSSESRCSSPKSKKEDCNTSSQRYRCTTRIQKSLVQHGKEKKIALGIKEKMQSESQEAQNITQAQKVIRSETEQKKIKSDIPKTSEDKPGTKNKRISLSVSRLRHSSTVNSERLTLLKEKVDAAIREHKVYSMAGHYSSVRRALKQRGWVEKIDSDLKGRRRIHRFDDTDENSIRVMGKNDMTNKESSEQFEAEVVNRMLRNITEDLCWLSKPYPYCWKDMNKCDMVNRLPKAYFSNKVGLANSLAHIQWYYEPGVCSTQYPRTYNISMREECDAFQEDFRLTACVATLKWLTINYKQAGEDAIHSLDGRVDTNVIEFALRRCGEYVKSKEHQDIDMMETPQTWDHQWDHFLTQYYHLVNDGYLLREVKEDPPITAIVTNAQNMLTILRPYWAEMDTEGINNLWIVKPGGRCCGNGILIRSHLDQIMAIINPTITRETRYVVQKYIERPLLIYKTKFDIRQWFLVTNVYPLTIWMYKESYLRFCSSTFSLKSTHESIHLCNNAVQRRYKNGKRDRNLPDENMWDSYTFQTHLKTIGHPNVWEEVIYPGMRESFVGALLASQDNMERRRNCFELYGADFMISEQLTDGPWLIEINANPAMDSSTSVTARMCPQVLEDIIKVVIDRRNDKNASTGAFELAYKQNCPPIPPYLGMSLAIRGKKIFKSSSEAKKIKKPNLNAESTLSEDSSCSDTDENVVKRRCTSDFMQPIITLRAEIARISLSTSNDHSSNKSDSEDHNTDTSDGMGERIALEGKEIELKKKKLRRKRQRTSQRHENKYDYRTAIGKKQHSNNCKNNEMSSFNQRDNSEKQIDYIIRSKESLKSNSAENLDIPSNHGDNNFWKNSLEKLQFYKDHIFSDQSLSKFKSKMKTKKKSSSEVETLLQQEVTSGTIVKSTNEVLSKESSIGLGTVSNQGPMIIAGLWEPKGSKQEEEHFNSDNTHQMGQRQYGSMELLRVNGTQRGRRSRVVSSSSLNLDSEKSRSNSAGDPFDFDVIESTRSLTTSLNKKSCRKLDFDVNFDRIMHNFDTRENRMNYTWLDRDFTKALSITAPDLQVKDRSKSNRWQTTKASMEYFREWKYKVDETRRNCEEMLSKLKHFKEDNSKVKFQDIIQSGKVAKEETQLMWKIKQRQTCKTLGKVPELRDRGRKFLDARCTAQRNGRKMLQDSPLTISTAPGAIMSVSEILPKIKQRNQLLLTNGIGSNSRNSPFKANTRKMKATRKGHQNITTYF